MTLYAAGNLVTYAILALLIAGFLFRLVLPLRGKARAEQRQARIAVSNAGELTDEAPVAPSSETAFPAEWETYQRDDYPATDDATPK
jgi:hypothetical protein